MTDHNFHNEFQAIISYAGDSTPEAVIDALAFSGAADALLAEVSAQVRPDITKATAKTIKAVHAAAAAYDVSHMHALAIAEAMTTTAVERVQAAWRESAAGIVATAAVEFDKTATKFYDELTRLGDVDIDVLEANQWNPDFAPIQDLARTLTRCAAVRDTAPCMGSNVVSEPYERLSRTATWPDNQTLMKFFNRHGMTANGIRKWVELGRWPGVRICWQTMAQQQAQPAPAGLIQRDQQMAARSASLNKVGQLSTPG